MATATKTAAGKLERIDGGKSGRVYVLPDGTVVPSVTSILGVIGKPALVNWAANQERTFCLEAAADLYEDLPVVKDKMSRLVYINTLTTRLGVEKAHAKEMAKAAEIGTQAHGLIEWNLKKELGQEVGPEPKVKDKATWAFMVYEEWRKKVNFRPVRIEQQVWSRTHEYAGTMDWLGWMTPFPDHPTVEVLTVGDWKTGKAIYDEALLQTAAYVMALIEMGHAAPPVNLCIVRLPKVETDPEPEMKIVPWSQIPWLFEQFLHARRLHRAMEQLKSGSLLVTAEAVMQQEAHIAAHAVGKAPEVESPATAELMAKQAEESDPLPETFAGKPVDEWGDGPVQKAAPAEVPPSNALADDDVRHFREWLEVVSRDYPKAVEKVADIMSVTALSRVHERTKEFRDAFVLTVGDYVKRMAKSEQEAKAQPASKAKKGGARARTRK